MGALLCTGPFLIAAGPHSSCGGINFAPLLMGLFLPSHPPLSGTPAAAPLPPDRGFEPIAAPSRVPTAQNEKEQGLVLELLFPLLALSQ